MKYNENYLNNGITATSNENFQLALEYFTKSILTTEGRLKIHSYKLRGFLLSNLDQHSEAIKDLNVVESFVKNDIMVYLCRGSNYHALGNYENALSDYIKALELDTSNYLVNHNLYLLFKERGDYVNALSAIKKVIKIKATPEAIREKDLIEKLLKQNETIVDKYKKILFIETETNGMPKLFEASYQETDNWPRLVRLKYSIYYDNGTLIDSDSIIIKPSNFIITDEVSAIHGITYEIANKKGQELELVLYSFQNKIQNIDLLVGHNLDFYEKVLGAEFYRLYKFNPLVKIKKYCTMKNTVELCKIRNSYGYKWPKLNELYKHLFNQSIDNQQNISNIELTARCYFEILKKEKNNLY